MARPLLAILLLLVLGGSADAAKRKKKKRSKTKTKIEQVTQTKKKRAEQPKDDSVEKTEATAVAAANPEMEVYRAIQKREQSTVQDLADLLLMYRGEFGKIPTAEKRLARARELKIIRGQKGGDILERGALAYAIMKVYQPESGVLFWLTGWERYAMRDVQEAGIMPAKAATSQHLSGEQLMGTITAAEEYKESKKKWGTDK